MIYHIYANQSNIGDWLSAKGIQSILKNFEITECFCDTPFVPETIDKLEKATEKDLIIIGGGGLLMDYFIPFWTAFKPFSERIPFCVWGIGFCDIKESKSLPPSPLIESILKNSLLSIVRDEMSRQHLSILDLPEPVQCPSCNVLILQDQPGVDFLHGVNFTTVGEEAYNQMCILGKEFSEKKGITYRETNNLIASGHNGQFKRVIGLYQRSKYVLSSALHGCIVAASTGKKLLAVSGDRKIEGFMEAIGLGNWVIDRKETNEISGMLKELDTQIDISNGIENIRKRNFLVGSWITEIYKQL